MADVIPISVPPKTLTGKRKNLSWRITFLPRSATRDKSLWMWEVVFTPSPRVYKGEATTLDEARQEVDTLVKKMTG